MMMDVCKCKVCGKNFGSRPDIIAMMQHSMKEHPATEDEKRNLSSTEELQFSILKSKFKDFQRTIQKSVLDQSNLSHDNAIMHLPKLRSPYFLDNPTVPSTSSLTNTNVCTSTVGHTENHLNNSNYITSVGEQKFERMHSVPECSNPLPSNLKKTNSLPNVPISHVSKETALKKNSDKNFIQTHNTQVNVLPLFNKVPENLNNVKNPCEHANKLESNFSIVQKPSITQNSSITVKNTIAPKKAILQRSRNLQDQTLTNTNVIVPAVIPELIKHAKCNSLQSEANTRILNNINSENPTTSENCKNKNIDETSQTSLSLIQENMKSSCTANSTKQEAVSAQTVSEQNAVFDVTCEATTSTTNLTTKTDNFGEQNSNIFPTYRPCYKVNSEIDEFSDFEDDDMSTHAPDELLLNIKQEKPQESTSSVSTVTNVDKNILHEIKTKIPLVKLDKVDECFFQSNDHDTENTLSMSQLNLHNEITDDSENFSTTHVKPEQDESNSIWDEIESFHLKRKRSSVTTNRQLAKENLKIKKLCSKIPLKHGTRRPQSAKRKSSKDSDVGHYSNNSATSTPQAYTTGNLSSDDTLSIKSLPDFDLSYDYDDELPVLHSRSRRVSKNK